MGTTKSSMGQAHKNQNITQKKGSAGPTIVTVSEGFRTQGQKAQPTSDPQPKSQTNQRQTGAPAGSEDQTPKDPKKLLYEYEIEVADRLQEN